MLDALVLADRPVEHDALFRVARRAAQRVLPDADRLDGDQDALRIEAVEDVGEPLALLADPIFFGDEQAVNEDGVGIDRLAPHLRDALHVDLRAVEIGVEDGNAVGRALAVFVFRGAGQQHDLARDLRGRGPNLLPSYDIAAGNLFREGLDARCIEASVRLGETEGALVFAGDQPRDPARFLLRRALHDDRVRTEQVD